MSPEKNVLRPGILAADGTDLVALYQLDQRPPRGGMLTRGDANPKIGKGEKLGFYSAGLMLAPSDLSGYQLCPFASKGCRGACLNVSGQGAIGLDLYGLNHCQVARIRRARYVMAEPTAAMADIVRELESCERYALKIGMPLAFRFNVLSDLRPETMECYRDGVRFPNLMEAFPDVTFYDYTKAPTQWRRDLCERSHPWPSNYSLTFSLSESNGEQAAEELANGVNVAVPFTTPTTKKTAADGSKEYRHALPPSAMLNGVIAAVIDGDATDLRFKDPRGVIVGLRAKGTKAGKAGGVEAGFILAA